MIVQPDGPSNYATTVRLIQVVPVALFVWALGNLLLKSFFIAVAAHVPPINSNDQGIQAAFSLSVH